jgi:hypothetical protein
LALKTHDAEVPPARGKIGLRLLANCELGTHLSIIESATRRDDGPMGIGKTELAGNHMAQFLLSGSIPVK